TCVNPVFEGRMLHYIVSNCRARVIVLSEACLPQLAGVIDRLEDLTTVVVPDATAEVPHFPVRLVTGNDLLVDATPAEDLKAPEKHDIACVVYTSGTTGPSKGVLVPWGLLSGSNPIWADLTTDDVFYSPFPMFHSAGRSPISWVGFPGGRVVIRQSFKTDE